MKKKQWKPYAYYVRSVNMDLKFSFRDPDLLHRIIDEIKPTISRPWLIMEICGGQTHSIMRHGLHQLLPPEIELIHGPGCPVCVTSIELIDKAISIASNPDVILTSYGDTLRVPGSKLDLYSVKANGGDIRVVYSPLDAIKIAQQNPAKQAVFFAIGFETTAPANAMTVLMADKLNLANRPSPVSPPLHTSGTGRPFPGRPGPARRTVPATRSRGRC